MQSARFVTASYTRPIVTVCLTSMVTACGGGGENEEESDPSAKDWGTAILIESDDNGDARVPRLAIDGSGNATAVWHQSDGTRDNIWANRYAAASGWGTAELIETNDAGSAFDPQVAVDADGNALTVWWQHDGKRFNIWANRYDAVTGWGTPVRLKADDSGSAFDPQIAVDANGNALAVWNQQDDKRYNIWANRYDAATGWGKPSRLKVDAAGGAFDPQVAMDADGNALAVWQQFYGKHANIWANRYDVAAGWGNPSRLKADDDRAAFYPQLSVDAYGNAVAVWWQHDGTRANIWANRYDAASGWGTSTAIKADDSGDAFDPQVTLDADGNALAFWSQEDETHSNIWANRHDVASGWSAPSRIKTDDSGGAFYPQLAVDADGNAFAVWVQHDGKRANVWANRYDAATGWGTPRLIETNNGGDAFHPQIAVDADGHALAVWWQHDGTRTNIWANRYE